MPYYRCPACGSMSHSVAAHSTAGVCAVCSAALPADAKLESLPESRFGVNRRLRAGLSAPAQARQSVAALPFGQCERDHLALLVSELVTNALRHAGLTPGDLIGFELASENGRVWIAVRDRGAGFDPDALDRSPRNFGYGLAIVASLAEDWGVELGSDGCTVWCSVEREAIAQ